MDVLLIYHKFAYKSQKQPLFFGQVGWIDKKISQMRSQSKLSTMNKYVGSRLLLFVQFFKIY